mmetsp:Transcript_20137/g.62058  ORF Transcript_20137/g.62058 Transcript_20137/m.62058 type:complete len:329 (+) Transcript_20137:75-1061(+)
MPRTRHLDQPRAEMTRETPRVRHGHDGVLGAVDHEHAVQRDVGRLERRDEARGDVPIGRRRQRLLEPRRGKCEEARLPAPGAARDRVARRVRPEPVGVAAAPRAVGRAEAFKPKVAREDEAPEREAQRPAHRARPEQPSGGTDGQRERKSQRARDHRGEPLLSGGEGRFFRPRDDRGRDDRERGGLAGLGAADRRVGRRDGAHAVAHEERAVRIVSYQFQRRVAAESVRARPLRSSGKPKARVVVRGGALDVRSLREKRKQVVERVRVRSEAVRRVDGDVAAGRRRAVDDVDALDAGEFLKRAQGPRERLDGLALWRAEELARGRGRD